MHVQNTHQARALARSSLYDNDHHNEVYYMLSGSGKMTIKGKEFAVKSGDAILTRSGSSHGLVQTGQSDLAIIISYQK